MVDTSIDAPEGGGAAIPIKLHVAGPRGSDDPTAYSSTRALIAELLASQPAAGAKKDADSKPPVVAIESLLSAKQGRGAHPGQDLVCGVLVSETRTELLMLRSQAMDNMWRFPGGQAGDDETLVSALARTLYDEIGAEIDSKGRPPVLLHMQQHGEWWVHTFLVFGYRGATAEHFDQRVNVEWKTVDEIRAAWRAGDFTRKPIRRSWGALPSPLPTPTHPYPPLPTPPL